MSFVRGGRPQQQQHSKGKRPLRPKKAAAAPKGEWVSTVHDLSVHKLTPAELSHRHEIHKSHNKAAAQWELREKALRRRLRRSGSPAPLDQTSLSIIREVFSDQLLLQDVLARSDRTMAVVKDLFGDAPRRQTGHPSVTMAPNCDSDSEPPVLQRPDPPTQLSLLSQSMMDQQALNELQGSEEDRTDEDVDHITRRASVRKMKARPRGGVIRPISDLPNTDSVPVTPCTSGRAPDQTALNATVAVQRVRTRQNQSEDAKEEPSALVSQVLNPDMSLNQSGRIGGRTRRTKKWVSQSPELDGSSVASLSGDRSSLGLLQAMLGQVEADLDSISPDTVPAPGSAQSPNQHRTQGLTGFSVALVSTLGRLVRLLRQTEEEAQKEAEERRRLEGELREQRGLIDALTAETMALREESAALQAELQQKLDTVVLVMGGLGLLEGHADPPQPSEVKVAVCRSAPDPERIQASVPPAVLLSPPRQRDNWKHSETPPVDNLCSCEVIQARSSASSPPLPSLPSTSSLSLTSDALSPQLPAEAVLAEIAELSRQSDLIRAQLSQTETPGSGVAGSPACSREQRRPSSSSSGQVTPQRVGERRTSGSSSTGRQNIIHVPDGDKVTHQAPSPNALSVSSVSSVQQRLLELNRQSAAARGRLLELIEQQKQSVSPSISPVPPSAGGGESPEVSVLPPAQEHLSQRRYAGSEVSSHSYRGETRAGKTQMEKQREAWFALSAHVR